MDNFSACYRSPPLRNPFAVNREAIVTRGRSSGRFASGSQKLSKGIAALDGGHD